MVVSDYVHRPGVHKRSWTSVVAFLQCTTCVVTTGRKREDSIYPDEILDIFRLVRLFQSCIAGTVFFILEQERVSEL